MEVKIGVKRSAQFEKTVSLGVNVIHVINDIQPFTDDKVLQSVMWNMHVLGLLKNILPIGQRSIRKPNSERARGALAALAVLAARS